MNRIRELDSLYREVNFVLVNLFFKQSVLDNEEGYVSFFEETRY